MVKNCANCGTTNAADSTQCMICGQTGFLATHVPVGNVDGTVVHDTAGSAPAVIIVVDERQTRSPRVAGE